MGIKIDWPARGHEYTKSEIDAVTQVLFNKKAALTQGDKVLKFEEKFAKYIGVKNAFSLMSAAHGLDIAAKLIEIKPGDEVIIPAHTYCASALAFTRRGAVIRWADINIDTLTVSIESIKSLVNEKTRAIVVVHLYGLICPEINEIKEYAKNKKLYLIEDCAQSLGSKLNNKHCGTFGDIACYSFHAQKNLTTLGEGGMIVVADNEKAKKVAGLRINGHAPFENKKEYWLPAMVNVDQDIEGIWPIKSTMNEAQAAIGLLVLDRIDDLTRKRRERGLMIRKELESFEEIKFQEIYSEESHSHHLLPALCKSENWHRDDLIRILFNKYGIKSIIQYYPLNRYDLFNKSGNANANIPVTDMFFDNMISFPFSLVIEDVDFLYMINSIKSSIKTLNNR
ncbi:MAG: DegT/DnrJ/EryC1/StrS family aminotransferase [Flavobacteriaceae bacterium]